MTRRLSHFCIVGFKSRRVAASDAFYVAEMYAVMPHSHDQKAGVVIYLRLSDQHLTVCFLMGQTSHLFSFMWLIIITMG